jgi:Leucine-rich repeat (LRR) protein
MEDALTIELIVIYNQQANSGNDQIATVRSVEIAFTQISKLTNLHYCYNLQELSLIETGPLVSLSGIETVSHSLETLRIIGCSLTQIDPLISSLTNLRDLILPKNSISEISNIQGCNNLRKLWLYSNNISKLENLDSNSYLQELWLQDNKIKVIENLENLINLQELHLSENLFNSLHSISKISCLSIIHTLSFGGLDFCPCPVYKQDGYKPYVLTTVTSEYLRILDGEYVSSDIKDGIKKDYMQEAIRLQDKLNAIEQEHRTTLMQLDSKNRENEEQLNYIQRMLIDDLHSLRTDIETGKSKIIKEHNRLKALRHKSEETLKSELSLLQNKYNKEIEKIVKDQQESIQKENSYYEESINALDFEEKIACYLIEVLYSSEGKVIYSEVSFNSPEYRFIDTITGSKVLKNNYLHIRKVYQVAAVTDNEILSNKYYFITISEAELKQLLLTRRYSGKELIKPSFADCIKDETGNYLVLVIRADNIEDIKINDLSTVVLEYLIVSQVSSILLEGDYRSLVDNRLLAFLSEPVVIYI